MATHSSVLAWRIMVVVPCKCMHVQSCLTLHDSMDCSLPGSSVHGVFQARVLEWGTITFSASVSEMYANLYKR